MAASASSPAATAGLGKHRIEALCDGIFAAAMTLLVFETKPPIGANGEAIAALGPQLIAMWPRFASCALSFVILGVYWVGHHNQFHYIKRSDRTLLWINVAFCLTVAFIPFSTALIGRYLAHHAAVAVYGANLVATGLLLYAQWRWATFHRHLVDADLDAQLVRSAGRRTLAGPLWYAIAIALSFVWLPLGLGLFVAVPVFFILPGRVDFSWSTLGQRRGAAPSRPTPPGDQNPDR